MKFLMVQRFPGQIAAKGVFMKKSVLLVMARLTHSGVETMWRAVGPDWRERGWQAHILSTGDDDEGPFADALRASGYHVHHIPFRRHGLFAVVGFFWAVWRLLRRHRFGVVYVCCERANLWFGLLAALSGARLIRTVHNVFAFTGGLRLRRRLQRGLLRAVGAVHSAPSRAVQANEAERFGNPCHLLDNWIDDARFPLIAPRARIQGRAALGLVDDQWALLTAGSCHDYKNHQGLIQALALLPEPVLLLHAGSGPLEAEEIALAQSLGVANRVRRLGVVEDMAAVLAAADLFIMPSLHEGLGLAAVEALASGLPCVLSQVAGLEDLSELSLAGAWCGTDAASIAQAVRAVMARDPAQRQAQARRDAERTRMRFASAAGLEQVLALFEGRV